jgi:dipeptidyl aminopeptidase/acylaminoacyl peptidase
MSRISRSGCLSKVIAVRTALILGLCSVLVFGAVMLGGCSITQTIDKALVTKHGLDAANAINAKARDGYDVREARAKWTQALQAYTSNDMAKTDLLIKESLALLYKSSTKVAERLYYKSADGTRVSGLLYKPEGAGPWPLIVVCHAGFGEGADFSEVALGIRDKGYVVFNPDFRGSGKSEGKHEAAKGEVDDTISGIKYVKSLGVVQDDRVGIYGQSHGAAVALLAAARYPGIKAVVEEAGFTDAVDIYNSESNSTDPTVVQLRGELLQMVGGTPDQVPEEYKVRSAIYYADKINAPVLLIHGAKDPLIPVSQAQRMYDALKAAGKTAQLKIYPDEAHTVSSPAGRAEVWEMMFAWFKKYV